MGGLCGQVGMLLSAQVPQLLQGLRIAVLSVALSYGVAEVRGATWPIPTRRWLVPQRWGLFGRQIYAALFGLSLGAGFLTVINFVGYYLIVGLCVLIASPQLGAVVFATYAMARAAPVLVAPFIWWLRGQAYTVESAATVNQRWLSNSDGVAWLRASVLVATAAAVWLE